MNVQQKGLITLVKSALNGEFYALPVNFSLEGVIDIACEHQISPLVYYGAINCGCDKGSEAMRALFDKAFPLVLLNEEQHTILEELCAAFEAKRIEYVPLKGSVLKALYPKPEMRTMGYIDILIKPVQYSEIRVLLEKFGFTEKTESDHEFVWVKGNICLELHKRLIPSYNKDYYAYFGDGWDFVKKCENSSKGLLLNETEFIYLFTHFAKHYRDGGIGIKHLTDLWVYKNAKPALDREYIKKELERLHLYKFFENIEKTLEVWFSDEDGTYKTRLISETIFGSGAYGEASAAEASAIIRESEGKKSVAAIKFSRFFKAVFLPYRSMCEKYKVLKKAPFLLPFLWVVRILDIAVFRHRRISEYMKKQNRITDDAVSVQKEKLNAVGLDFYSEADAL